MYTPTDDPLWERIPHWIRLAMPDDVAQEIALARILAGANENLALRLLVFRLRLLRWEAWDRIINRRPRANPALRPSKISRAKGYRRDPARKREAAAKLTPEQRSARARKAAAARWRCASAEAA